jgi:fructokinase
VLVVGEALVDIVQRTDGTVAEYPGGSPANVALGLARLERGAELLTRIGTDARGSAIRQHLEASGVRLVEGSITQERTSTATARLDEQGVASYEFDLDWRVNATPDLSRYAALHTGSIAAFLPPGADDVVRLVEAASQQIVVTYDPNARPRLMGVPSAGLARVEKIVPLADVVKVSDEDLGWLVPDTDPVEVARAWQASGPGLVIVTFGGKGVSAVSAAGEVQVVATPVDVVDTVGAGDSFMSALLDYLWGADLLGVGRAAAIAAMPREQIEAMLQHAVQVAAITCGRAGANPPTRAELAALAG